MGKAYGFEIATEFGDGTGGTLAVRLRSGSAGMSCDGLIRNARCRSVCWECQFACHCLGGFGESEAQM